MQIKRDVSLLFFAAVLLINLFALSTLRQIPAVGVIAIFCMLALCLFSALKTFRIYRNVHHRERDDSRSFSLGISIISGGLFLAFVGRLFGLYSRYDSESGFALVTLDDRTLYYFLAVWFNLFWAPALALASIELLRGLREAKRFSFMLDFLCYGGAIVSLFGTVIVLTFAVAGSLERALDTALMLAAANTALIFTVGLTVGIISRSVANARPLLYLSSATLATVGSVAALIVIPSGTGHSTAVSDCFFVLAWLFTFLSATNYYKNGLTNTSYQAKPSRRSSFV